LTFGVSFKFLEQKISYGISTLVIYYSQALLPLSYGGNIICELLNGIQGLFSEADFAVELWGGI